MSEKGIEIYCEDWDYAVENTLRKNTFSFVNIGDGIMAVRDKMGISSGMVASIICDWEDPLESFKSDFYIIISGPDHVSVVRKDYLEKLSFLKDDSFILSYMHSKEVMSTRVVHSHF